MKNALDGVIEILKKFGCTAEETWIALVRLGNTGASAAEAGKNLREVMTKLKESKNVK